MAALKDRTGIRYGRLVVLSLDSIRKDRPHHTVSYWKCRCDCGNTAIVSGQSLENGSTKSCGCYRKEVARNRVYQGDIPKLHGVWIMMRKRCFDPNCEHYHNYGGRGITVCGEWSGDGGYHNFRDWAKRNGYADGLTLDRIDNNGNYEPNNCAFVSRKAQSNNKRNNVRVEIDGMVHTLAEWCEIYKVPYSRVRVRYRKMGWSIKAALETPPLSLRRKQYAN